MIAAAYELGSSFEAWFAQSLALFRRQMDDGFGAYGAIVRREPPAPLFVRLDGAHEANLSLMKMGVSLGFYDRLSPGFGAGTATQVLGVDRHARVVAPLSSVLRFRDSCGIYGPDDAGLTLVFAAPRRNVGSVGPKDRWLSTKALPHFATALRLRRSLTGLSLDTPSAEALFEPGGRCVNAQGMAESRSAREALRAAALALDSTRREESGEDGRAALLSGRWSLVDRFDSDGRRFIVAYRNPKGVLDPRRLSEREREVAARLAQGWNQASLAAELGVRASTVASIAASVVQKLGLSSTRELPLFWRDAGGHVFPLGSSDLLAFESAAPRACGARLTAAERAVLSGVIQGHSNQTIAKLRGTSLRTVANQVAALLTKLRAGSRAELSAKSLALND